MKTYSREWLSSGIVQQRLHREIMISAVWLPVYEAITAKSAAVGQYVGQRAALLRLAVSSLPSRFGLKISKQTLAVVGRRALIAYSAMTLVTSVLVLSDFARTHSALHASDRGERTQFASLEAGHVVSNRSADAVSIRR